MTREDKDQLIAELTEQLDGTNVLYLADVSEMTVEKSNNLRRQCFQNGVKLKVVKNKLLLKAMERVEGKDYSELYDVLKGNTSIMLAEAGNAPAKVIKEFRKKEDKPLLKGAWVEESVYVGEEHLDALVAIKSKDELLGEIVTLLQSPAKNAISALKAPAGNLASILKTLEEKAA